MVEGRPADQHLVGEHADRPDVHEVVVGLALEDLGADVVQGAAVGGPALLAVGGPPEVAQLGYSLYRASGTLVSTMF